MSPTTERCAFCDKLISGAHVNRYGLPFCWTDCQTHWETEALMRAAEDERRRRRRAG